MYLNCPSILTVCEDEQLQVQGDQFLKKLIVDENIKESLNLCDNLKQNRHLEKRSPVAKKRGGRGGSSRTSSSSRGRLSSRIRSGVAGTAGRKGQKVLGSIFGSKKGMFGSGRKFATKGVKRKGSILRKAGKYAIIGLAG